MSGVSQYHGTTLGMSLFPTPQLLHGWELTHGRMVHCTIRNTKRSLFSRPKKLRREKRLVKYHMKIYLTLFTQLMRYIEVVKHVVHVVSQKIPVTARISQQITWSRLCLQSSSKRLKDLCDSIGIDSNGSCADLINRLNEMVLFKDVYPKMFRRVKICGGEFFCKIVCTGLGTACKIFVSFHGIR